MEIKQIKEVPIECYERLIKLQGNSMCNDGIVVIPFLADLKRRNNENGRNRITS